MKCLYHDDMDGRASAAVHARAAIQGAWEYLPMEYAAEIPFEAINPGEAVWVLDYSLQRPGEWERLLAITPDVVWIDHHKTAIERARGGPAESLLGIRREGSESACLLTWEFFPDHDRPTPHALELISDRDTWSWRFGQESAHFHAGAGIEETHPCSEFWNRMLRSLDPEGAVAAVCQRGVNIVRFKEVFYRELRQAIGFETTIEGHRALALNVARTGSEGFGFPGGWRGALPDEYAILMPFYWDGRQFTVSLYSNQVDVSVIAKRRGGGGHPGASGFQCDALPEELRAEPWVVAGMNGGAKKEG